jgi:hypothetical protein
VEVGEPYVNIGEVGFHEAMNVAKQWLFGNSAGQ